MRETMRFIFIETPIGFVAGLVTVLFLFLGGAMFADHMETALRAETVTALVKGGADPIVASCAINATERVCSLVKR